MKNELKQRAVANQMYGLLPDEKLGPSLQKTSVVNQMYGLLQGKKLGPYSAAATIPTNLNILSIQGGRLRVTLPVVHELTNCFGKLHGGAMSTLIEVLLTAFLLASDGRSCVTVDLHITYLATALIGSTILIDATVDHIGRSMVFSSFRIYRLVLDDGEDNAYTEKVDDRRVLVAKGSLTKKVINLRIPSNLCTNLPSSKL